MSLCGMLTSEYSCGFVNSVVQREQATVALRRFSLPSTPCSAGRRDCRAGYSTERPCFFSGYNRAYNFPLPSYIQGGNSITTFLLSARREIACASLCENCINKIGTRGISEPKENTIYLIETHHSERLRCGALELSFSHRSPGSSSTTPLQKQP